MRVKILIIRVQPPSHCFLSLEIMSGAAAHLLKLLECYARQPRPLPCAMCKISPSALPSRDRSYEYAYSAQKLLDNLPLCVEELAVSMEEQESLLLLARTLSQYLQQHGLRTGGKGGEGFAGTRCAFIAWVIASVFSTFAETTEEVWGRDTLRVAWTNVEAVANSPLHNRRWEAISEHIREDMRTNEAYKLPWNARDAFDACFGVEGEDLDPLTVEPDLFEQFFLSCVDPILDRFSDAARPISEVIGELAGAIDFDTLRSHLTRQFGYIPFSPEGGALLAVAATASSNAPLMFLVKRYLAECYSVLDTLDNHGLCSRTNESRRQVHWFNTELLHAFALVHEAVQVIPTCWHLGALGWDAESICHSGCWIPVKEGSKHLYHQLRPSNTTVVSPGLSIAATAVSGGGGAPGETAERALTTGTVLLSPPQDEARLFLSQVELSTYISRTSVDDGLSVAIVPIESFRMVEVLLLFQDLPPADAERVDVERLTLASLNVWLNNEAQSGIVIIAVTNHIDKTAMRQIEEWGSSARQVVVVGSIGEWAMSQLVLAFATMPNCGRTCLSSLRAVRRQASTRLYALDEVTYRYPSTNGADLHERLTRIVVLVAQIPEADGDGQVNSMLDGSDSDDSDASISSMGTDGRGSTLSDIIDESGIPLYPTVTMSVLLGGATPASQQLALYTFREAQRYVTHRVVLPGPMGSVVPGDGTVELALVNALRNAKYDQLCGMNEEDTPDESQGPAEEIVELRKRYQRTRALFFSRIGKALETAIWHFQILATQHQCDSSPESAWEECTSRMQEQCIQHPESESFQTSIGKLCEPYFSARDAYVIIGKCLDQLCRTVIVGRRTPVQEGSGFDTKGEPRGAELFLHPTIE